MEEIVLEILVFLQCIFEILVFGDDGVILSYDVERESWDEWEGENHGIEFETVFVGENVFIMGGEKKYNGKLQRLSSVSIYNVRTKKWKKGPSMMERRRAFGACVSPENTIYMIGGYKDKDIYLSSVESLKCDKNGEPSGGCTMLPSISTDRFGLGAALIDDQIYAVGGRDGRNRLTQVEVFDPKLNVWKECCPMSEARSAHCVATYNKELYVFDQDGDCEKYNPVTDTWATIASCPMRACYRGSAVLDGKIYLVGGLGCKETDSYDPNTNTWSKGSQLPRVVGITKCVVWK